MPICAVTQTFQIRTTIGSLFCHLSRASPEDVGSTVTFDLSNVADKGSMSTWAHRTWSRSPQPSRSRGHGTSRDTPVTRKRPRSASSAEEGEIEDDSSDEEGEDLMDVYDEKLYPLYTHVSNKLVRCIAKGMHVELSKLLPDEKPEENQELIDFARKTGMKFLIPNIKARQEKVVDNLQSWTTAFRIYHSILAHFQPERSAELLQDEHNISQAARTFPWSQVAT